MAFTTLISHWHFDPILVVFIAAVVSIYWSVSRFRRIRSNWLFACAMSVFLIMTCSPVHYLGMHYYFSVYMICHVSILLICGPLLVMSIPRRPYQFWENRLNKISAKLAARPWLCWLAGVSIMWFWHIPAIFDSGMTAMHGRFTVLTFLHPATMLAAGFVFAWPLFSRFSTRELHPLTGVLYLFTACVSCSLLGLLITFAPPGTYHHYMQMTGMDGRPWNISWQEDQQAAGLIMWVPCCFLYLSGCIYLLLRWFSEKPLNDQKRSNSIKPTIP
ncbi:MAG TPA: cytochrome c oxidase assembly protein [Mucilaginibacter sp.]